MGASFSVPALVATIADMINSLICWRYCATSLFTGRDVRQRLLTTTTLSTHPSEYIRDGTNCDVCACVWHDPVVLKTQNIRTRYVTQHFSETADRWFDSFPFLARVRSVDLLRFRNIICAAFTYNMYAVVQMKLGRCRKVVSLTTGKRGWACRGDNSACKRCKVS